MLNCWIQGLCVITCFCLCFEYLLGTPERLHQPLRAAATLLIKQIQCSFPGPVGRSWGHFANPAWAWQPLSITLDETFSGLQKFLEFARWLGLSIFFPPEKRFKKGGKNQQYWNASIDKLNPVEIKFCLGKEKTLEKILSYQTMGRMSVKKYPKQQVKLSSRSSTSLATTWAVSGNIKIMGQIQHRKKDESKFSAPHQVSASSAAIYDCYKINWTPCFSGGTGTCAPRAPECSCSVLVGMNEKSDLPVMWS